MSSRVASVSRFAVEGDHPRYKWVALSNTTLGVLMATINSSIVIISLPEIFRGIKLDPLRPGNVSYLVLRLADDSFVHISFHGHAPGETNPIASTDAFARFQDGHGDRRQGEVDQQKASLVGAYLTVIG